MRAPALLLAAALLALAAPPAHAQALPDGCAWSGVIIQCEWRFDTREDPEDAGRAFEVPLFDVTLARITVALDGIDNGWAIALCPTTGSCNTTARISSSTHTPDRSGTTYVVETSIHLARGEEVGDRARLVMRTGGVYVLGDPLPVEGPTSLGEFRVVYRAEPLPPGTPPERPAATRDVPHVLDPDLDGRQPATDVVAVWLDDARLGDGVMEAHLALKDLSEVDYGNTGPRTSGIVSWDVLFRVAGTDYALRYEVSTEPRVLCRLLLGDPAEDIVVTHAECAFDRERGEITWAFPEEAIGSPGPGVPFEDLRAETWESAIMGSYHQRRSIRADDAHGMRFPFALGGPAVWDAQNGGAFVPEPVAPLAWHQDPLAQDNLPDTLQVLGALAAGATFLFGLLVVRRRRAQTRRLIDEVDALERAHERDAHRALLALGELESRVTRLFRDGTLQESQYQVVSQRIASVATRFALRRELGLDDGTPGTGAAR